MSAVFLDNLGPLRGTKSNDPDLGFVETTKSGLRLLQHYATVARFRLAYFTISTQSHMREL
jgi:hypothetical protein